MFKAAVPKAVMYKIAAFSHVYRVADKDAECRAKGKGQHADGPQQADDHAVIRAKSIPIGIAIGGVVSMVKSAPIRVAPWVHVAAISAKIPVIIIIIWLVIGGNLLFNARSRLPNLAPAPGIKPSGEQFPRQEACHQRHGKRQPITAAQRRFGIGF